MAIYTKRVTDAHDPDTGEQATLWEVWEDDDQFIAYCPTFEASERVKAALVWYGAAQDSGIEGAITPRQ